MGLIFGWASSAAGGDLDLRGSVEGGAIAGLIIGALAPLFRSRWKGGLIVTIGMSIAFFIAMPSLRDQFGPAMTTFLGLCAGITYSIMFWDYRGPESRNEAPPVEDK